MLTTRLFKYGLLLACLSCSTFADGQTIGSYLISSAGSSIMSPDGAFYLAVGEPMNTELTDGEIMISQGFLQVTIQGSIVSDDNLLEEQITVYPNPSSQNLYFKLEGPSQEYAYQLYDLLGQSIAEKAQLDENLMDVSQLQPGAYLLTITKGDKSSATFKIIKE